MIFASLGTMDMPFVRMARAVDLLAASTEEEVIVQTGWTDYEYKHAKAFKFCTKDEMQQYIGRASLLIMQGGWGAISEAMEKHKRMVIIPRYDKTEHIHDQFQLIRKLDELGCVIGVFDVNCLPEAIERARTFCFRQIDKGNAEHIIIKKLKEWFG
ncbi:MAG: glycosyl transferase family 28 [Prevotella sp.]|nr:glycosyl transferase family 28 [Prevotella sp.]